MKTKRCIGINQRRRQLNRQRHKMIERRQFYFTAVMQSSAVDEQQK